MAVIGNSFSNREYKWTGRWTNSCQDNASKIRERNQCASVNRPPMPFRSQKEDGNYTAQVSIRLKATTAFRLTAKEESELEFRFSMPTHRSLADTYHQYRKYRIKSRPQGQRFFLTFIDFLFF